MVCDCFLGSSWAPTPTKTLLTLYPCRELDKQGMIVGLSFSIKSGTITTNLATLFTLMNYNKTAFCVGFGSNRSKLSATFVSSVTRIYIYVQRPKAERAMIARTFSHRQNFFSAMQTNECLIFFSKTFLFHKYSSVLSFESFHIVVRKLYAKIFHIGIVKKQSTIRLFGIFVTVYIHIT